MKFQRYRTGIFFSMINIFMSAAVSKCSIATITSIILTMLFILSYLTVSNTFFLLHFRGMEISQPSGCCIQICRQKCNSQIPLSLNYKSIRHT